jgi:hypothetical protein
MTAPPQVRLVIDRLVLHGVDRADAAAVRRALNGALEAALAGAGGFEGGRDVARIRLQLPPAVNAAHLGHSAGRALGAALVGGGERPR